MCEACRRQGQRRPQPLPTSAGTLRVTGQGAAQALGAPQHRARPFPCSSLSPLFPFPSPSSSSPSGAPLGHRHPGRGHPSPGPVRCSRAGLLLRGGGPGWQVAAREQEAAAAHLAIPSWAAAGLPRPHPAVGGSRAGLCATPARVFFFFFSLIFFSSPPLLFLFFFSLSFISPPSHPL